MASGPALTVIDPDGNRTRVPILEFPFRMGRQADNHLVLRDARASRAHAQLTLSEDDYVLEDLASRHGVFVNDRRIDRVSLQDGDQIRFGFPDSYTLIFERSGNRVAQIADHLSETDFSTRAGVGGNLARLRAVLEIGRALQTSFSLDSVLCAVVDAALVITNAERGFLLIRADDELVVRCARDRSGFLRDTDLDVPRNLIRKALDERKPTFSMNFDLHGSGDPSSSAEFLNLKSVVCVPLVRVRIGAPAEASPPETIGVIYMDSRSGPRDLAAGNRELLETLGIEASTVLENARLLEEQRTREHIQEELAVARHIQQSLLPRNLPLSGWLRAAASSTPSRHVGGDYYDLFPIGPDHWAVVVADVAGKGVSSALVASLLQGAFLSVDSDPASMLRSLTRINSFFRERSEGQKYATLFCALLHRSGQVTYVNAGHCAPLHVTAGGAITSLRPTSPPVGLLDKVTFATDALALLPGDRLIVYSDGITEAQNEAGEFFGKDRLAEIIRAHASRPCGLLHRAILDAIDNFTAGHEQADDLTLVVLEYLPD